MKIVVRITDPVVLERILAHRKRARLESAFDGEGHRPRAALAKFETWVAAQGDAHGYRDFLGLLRAAVPVVAPDRYRGISRFVLERYWEGEKQLPVELPDLAARIMIFDRLGPDPNMEYSLVSFDPDLLPDLPFAQEVLAATERPADWEVVHVLRDAPPGSQRTLGFDVGYWGNSHFSPEGGVRPSSASAQPSKGRVTRTPTPHAASASHCSAIRALLLWRGSRSARDPSTLLRRPTPGG